MSKREHDHEESEEEVIEDNSSEDSGGNAGGGGGKTSNAAQNMAKKAGRKMGKKMAKKMAKAIGKAVVKVIGKLIALLGPYVLGAIVIIGLIAVIAYIAFDIGYETKGKEQEYQDEDTRLDNKKKKDDKGDYISMNMSSGNKIVKAFYAYYTNQSYYKVLDGKMVRADSQSMKDVQDKYKREKEFMLSPDFLWSLDEHLNKKKFRYPEQFIQVVYHDPKTFELKQLTNKNDRLTAKSTKYDEKTGEKVPFKKVPGVWDYGFAPILQYKNYKEQQQKRGTMTEKEVWNIDKQAFETQKVKNGKSWVENVDGFPKSVYMIEKVTTSIGTISNKIKHEWQNTGEPWTKTITDSVKVSVRYKEKVKEPVLNKYGKPLYYPVDEKGKIIEGAGATIEVTPFPVTRTVEVTKYKPGIKKAKRTIEGYVWSKEPRYEGEPDTSKIVGSKYMEDYMFNYTAQVPENAMGSFNLKDRTGKDIKGLESILKDVTEDLDAKSDYDNAGSTSDTSVDNLMNVQGGSANFKKAMQYIEYYQKYGEMYGVDPLLLASKGAQERAGVHGTSIDGGGAIGISQIQVGSHLNQTRKAFNYKTGKWDSVQVTMSKLSNLETNIQIGAMIFQMEMKEQEYNPLIGLQAYNYGQGAILDVISNYARSKGISVSAVRKDVKNTEWMAWRQKVRPGYGDGQYIEHVLSHYPSGNGQKPWILDDKGNKVFIDGDIKMGAGISMTEEKDGSSNSIWDFMDALIEKWGELFPDSPKDFSKKHIKVVNKQIGDTPIDILNLSFAMTEKKLFSEYGYITPKEWKEKYKLLFSAPPSSTGANETGLGDKLNEFFPSGYGEVVAKATKIAVPYNGKGISIQAPEGSKVLAIADGTVKEVGRDFVVIDHGTGAITRYSTLKEVKVKKGDKVKKGATVGISGKNVFFEVQLDGQPSDPSWVVGGGSVSNGSFITPAQGRLSSPFGNRQNPTGYGTEFHPGVDIANTTGTPIKAAAGGTVTKAGMNGAYGNLIQIKHTIGGKEMSTVYGHLSAINVRVGDTVTQGQIIGAIGSTGRSTGPHLHFEIHNGVATWTTAALDPAKYIKL